MSDTQPDPSWWLAVDGRWYPPELHPDAANTPTGGPTFRGSAGSGPTQIRDRAERGRIGEEATERALKSLPTDYTVFQGLRVGPTGGDIDHLVVGPTGVWVLDTKRWTGRVTVSNGELYQGGSARTKHLVDLHGQAEYAGSVLGTPVNAVMCFVDTDLDRDAQMVGRSRVMTLDGFMRHLAEQPRQLSSADISRIAERADSWFEHPPERRIPRPPREPPVATSVARSPGAAPTGSIPRRLGRRLASRSAQLIVALIFLAFVADVIRSLSHVRIGTGTATSTTTTTASATAAPNDLRVSIDCPVAGKGFLINGRTQNGATIRVSAAIGGLPMQYVGELREYGRMNPIRGVGPNQSIGFDVQRVNEVGQGLDTYHFDVSTPANPC